MVERTVLYLMKGFDPVQYDAWYETPFGRLSDRIEKELIFSLANIKPGEKVLDAGCGTGNYSLELRKRGASVTAIDSSGKMVGRAKEKAERDGLDIRFQIADAYQIPFADASFDAVVSVGLLCFLKEPERALLEMRRVLRPDGRLILGLLNRRSPWAWFRRIKGVFTDSIYSSADFVSPRQARMLLKQCGFEPRVVESCLFFFPVNNSLCLKLAKPLEKWGRFLIPERGAFLGVLSLPDK